MQSEKTSEVNDYFSQMTEASSRGIILKSDPPKVSTPQLINKTDYIFKVDAEVRAYVVVPAGEGDASFSVEMTANKKIFQENENIKLTVISTKDAYLTILHVRRDTIEVAFPNALNPRNKITAHTPLVFPSGYDIVMELEKTDTRSEEEFITIVSKDDIPLAGVNESQLKDGTLALARLSLNNLSELLYKVPIGQRVTTHLVVEIVK